LHKIIPILAVLAFNFSCITAFKIDMKSKFDNAGIDYRTVQFYNIGEIVLKRTLKSEEVKTAKGIVNFQNGQYYEKVIIRNSTPCLIEKVDDNKNILYVRFEEGVNRLIEFRPYDYEYFFDFLNLAVDDSIGKITYDGKEYKVLSGKNVKLGIKKSDKFEEREESRIIKGIIIK
jgi:hypothetical protein